MKPLFTIFLVLALIQIPVMSTRAEPRDMQSQPKYFADNGCTFIPLGQKEKQVPTWSMTGSPSGKKSLVATQSSPRSWRIVIDPGHGGNDRGAIGPDGLMEKDVVLRIAEKLRDKLKEEPGCQPILTREIDTSIPLEERAAVANIQKADIFLSVHTNASPNPKTRGIETFVLESTTDTASMKLAARENGVPIEQLTALQYILYDLRRTGRITSSYRLAELVQLSICKGLSESYSQVCNLGVREAPFRVLAGTNMPSILVEVSFISNQIEEQRLKDDRYLDRLAEAIKEGIVQYMREIGEYPSA